jgi:hypothetical protein
MTAERRKKPPSLLTATLHSLSLHREFSFAFQEPMMPADKLGQPPPIVQAMILADHIHQDPTTGKRYILGTYSRITAKKYPHQTGLSLYLAITGGHGPTSLRMRIVDVDETIGPLHESVFPVDLGDPNRVYEITFNSGVVFPCPGDYRLQLYAGHDLLRELRLVTRTPPRGDQSVEET